MLEKLPFLNISRWFNRHFLDFQKKASTGWFVGKISVFRMASPPSAFKGSGDCPSKQKSHE